MFLFEGVTATWMDCQSTEQEENQLSPTADLPGEPISNFNVKFAIGLVATILLKVRVPRVWRSCSHPPRDDVSRSSCGSEVRQPIHARIAYHELFVLVLRRLAWTVNAIIPQQWHDSPGQNSDMCVVRV